MSEFRHMPICFEDIEEMEREGEELMRLNRAGLGVKALARSLRLRQEWSMHEPLAFACDVDESAGMADVVEMHDQSRRV